LVLAACGPINRGLESVNQPVVQRTDYAIDLGASGYDGLSAGEAARLAGWFDSLRLGYGDRVAIDDPSRAGGAAAQEAVAAVVARYGLLLTDPAPVTEGAIPGGRLRVVVSRSVAGVPNCPNWRGAATPDFAGSTMANYGCATNSNLAAMVADPQDLLQGRTASADRSNRALIRAGDAYQRLVPTGVNGTVAAPAGGVGGGK
ncbi:MAG: CpaD family pilus assembly lipoprotein, partial [Sphingomonas sp.]